MSTYAPASSSHEPSHSLTSVDRARPRAPQRMLANLLNSQTALPAALTAGALCTCTFLAGGGLDLESRTSLELVLTLGGGLLAASAIAFAPRGARHSGLWATGLLFGLAALVAISVSWSVSPDTSWQEAGLLLSYGALFAAAALLARATPGRWSGVLLGIVIAAVVVCGYALLAKVLPAQLDSADPYARLRVPYDYWNATGLSAAMGIVACLWLGTRRVGNALVSALAYPAIGLLIVTLMLAYSRGALAVAFIGAAIWLCLVPRRLRGALMLIVCGGAAAVVVGFDFSSSALSSEAVALSARVKAGHQLGALLGALMIALAIAGVAIGFTLGRRPRSQETRRQVGIALLALPAALVLAALGGLAHSQRGLTGTISHALSTVTNPNATVPNTPGRLTAVASARARYWKQAIEVFEAHPALGAGGGGYATARKQYETSNQVVIHAHGFLVQTLADLGLVGVALTLLLLGAWAIAAGRATHPFNRRWSRWRWQAIELSYTPERVALITMLCIVITFGLHSFVDWTWYVPGTACVALICAGWLAGRGPIERATVVPAGPWRHLLRPRITPLRAGAAAAVIVLALLAAWSEWQPQRSNEASQEALVLASSHPHAAMIAARAAVSRDPLSIEALARLAAVQEAQGENQAARATLQKAVRQQPANPQAWSQLGVHDLSDGDPTAALAELRAAYYLNPDGEDRSDYVLALRAATTLKTAPAARSRAASHAPRAALRGLRSPRFRSESPAAARAGCLACRSANGRGGDRSALRRLLRRARARAGGACRGQAC